MSDLAQFGHHPDPAIDFCIEVEALEGMAYDRSVGLPAPQFAERVERALQFRVGGDEGAVAAKNLLRSFAQKHTVTDRIGVAMISDRFGKLRVPLAEHINTAGGEHG